MKPLYIVTSHAFLYYQQVFLSMNQREHNLEISTNYVRNYIIVLIDHDCYKFSCKTTIEHMTNKFTICAMIGDLNVIQLV